MGSATVTYGKKRNLLRSLGSHRRQTQLVESASTRKTASLAATTSTANEAPWRTARKRSIGDPQSIDEMASRLLDDSTLTIKGGGENASPNKRRATTPITSRPVEDDPAISPLALPPPLEKPPASSETHMRNPRVGKHSPKGLGRAPRRAATTRVRRDASQKRKESGLQRPLGPTRTLSLDPLKFHPLNNLASSTSVPLSVVDGNVRHRALGQRTATPSAEPPGADDINQKLHDMLAATDALKPSPPKPTTSSTSRFTRIVPTKVFAKVSNAWDRLHSKPSPQDVESNEKLVFDGKGDDNVAGWKNAYRPSPANLSPISSIEIRLNEGDNLNRRKVQRIVGGQVIRKPVADDGKSLRNGKSLDDPFSEVGGWRTRTTFNSRLTMSADHNGSGIPPVPGNPFESEKGFDIDIEDRILNSTPVGCSTPRIRVERDSASSFDQSPTTKATRSAQEESGLKLSGASSDLGRTDSARGHRLKLNLPGTGRSALVDKVDEARRGWEDAAGGFDAFEPKRVKKHPSPSKEALENLEVEFRKYTRLRVPDAAFNEVDELSPSFPTTSPSAKSGHRNRPSFSLLSVSNIDDIAGFAYRRAHHRPGSPASTISLSRPQRASENPLKLHREIRLAPPYRPSDFSPHDVDELQ
ncbi:hypothetical protein ACJZ2D_013026 [Fusarium nematophilum]